MNIELKNGAPMVFKKTALALVVSAILGCGGGGGDGHNERGSTSPGTIDTGGEENPDSMGVNGDLAGALYYDDANGRHVKLDLKSGIEIVNPISPDHWESFYKNVDDFDIDEKNQRFALVRVLQGDNIQIYTLDKNYNLFDNFMYEGYAYQSFHVSPDGKYFSLISKSWNGRAQYFTIFKNDGQVLYEVECNACNDHEWMKDSSGMLVSIGTSLRLMEVNSTEENIQFSEVQILNLAENGLYPQSLAVSPDGKKLAFRASTGSQWEDMHEFVVNVDGTELRQVTGGSLEGEWQVKWAKDGKGLFVVAGHDVPVPFPTPLDCHKELFWVNENADKVILDDKADPFMAKSVKKMDENKNVYSLCGIHQLTESWEL